VCVCVTNAIDRPKVNEKEFIVLYYLQWRSSLNVIYSRWGIKSWRNKLIFIVMKASAATNHYRYGNFRFLAFHACVWVCASELNAIYCQVWISLAVSKKPESKRMKLRKLHFVFQHLIWQWICVCGSIFPLERMRVNLIMVGEDLRNSTLNDSLLNVDLLEISLRHTDEEEANWVAYDGSGKEIMWLMDFLTQEEWVYRR
jgi:hypothetical protein